MFVVADGVEAAGMVGTDAAWNAAMRPMDHPLEMMKLMLVGYVVVALSMMCGLVLTVMGLIEFSAEVRARRPA